jgi:hypothetical protein
MRSLAVSEMKMQLLAMTCLVLVWALVRNILRGPRFVNPGLAMVLVPKVAVVKVHQLMEIRSLVMGLEPDLEVCRPRNNPRHGHLINKALVPATEVLGMVLPVLVPALDLDTALGLGALMAPAPDTVVVVARVVMQVGHTVLAAAQAGLTMAVWVHLPALASVAPVQVQTQEQRRGLLEVVPRALK